MWSRCAGCFILDPRFRGDDKDRLAELLLPEAAMRVQRFVKVPLARSINSLTGGNNSALGLRGIEIAKAVADPAKCSEKTPLAHSQFTIQRIA